MAKKHRKNSFLSWLLIELIPNFGTPDNDEFNRKISEATKCFTEVQLTMQINGLEVDTKKFIERLENAMDDAVGRAARKVIDEQLDITPIQDEVYKLEQILKDTREDLIKKLQDLNLDIRSDEYDY